MATKDPVRMVNGLPVLPTINRKRALSARGRAKFWKAFNKFMGLTATTN